MESFLFQSRAFFSAREPGVKADACWGAGRGHVCGDSFLCFLLDELSERGYRAVVAGVGRGYLQEDSGTSSKAAGV